MKVQVRLWNLTLQPLKVFWGEDTIDMLVLDDQDKPATWLGRYLYFMSLSINSVSPLDMTTISDSLDLTEFNPDLPLPPGHYTLRVHLGNLNIHLDPLLWIPGESKTIEDVTLPDVPFEIVP